MSGVILPRRRYESIRRNFHNPSSSKHLLLCHNTRANSEYQSQRCHVASTLLRGLAASRLVSARLLGTNVETLPVICTSSRAARTLPRSHFQESAALINLRRIFPREILRHIVVASISYFVTMSLTLRSLAIYIVIQILLSA